LTRSARVLAGICALACAGVLLTPSSGAAPASGSSTAAPFLTGFYDEAAFAPPGGRVWLARARASGASVIRIPVSWSGVAPSRPADPTDPADPAYDWGALDSEVDLVIRAGLTPIISVNAAPAWAEGPNMPKSATAGSWEPNAAAFGAFATALARRYSGHYADPRQPGFTLPAVHDYQAWNEPNLSVFLAPQWRRTRGGYAPVSPPIYRSLLNAFYAGVTSVLPHAVVATAGTGPFGDPPGAQRMPPAQFVRALLCISVQMRPLPCPNPAHFDVLAHHPYAVGAPFTGALDTDDVSISDFRKLEQPLAVAERTGRALPAGPKAIWATEVSYDSDPPDPQAVPMPTLDRWVAETLYELWSEGVSLVTWFLIEDQPPDPNYADTYQSGMYFLDGRPKQAQRAFLFPLVVDSRTPRRTILWLRTPAAGTLVVEERVGGSWRRLFARAVSRHEIVDETIAGARGTAYRASVAGVASLVWSTSARGG
jgi:hypothetical protein